MQRTVPKMVPQLEDWKYEERLKETLRTTLGEKRGHINTICKLIKEIEEVDGEIEKIPKQYGKLQLSP